MPTIPVARALPMPLAIFGLPKANQTKPNRTQEKISNLNLYYLAQS